MLFKAALACAPLAIFNPLHEELLTIFGFSLLVYVVSSYMIPRAAPALMKIGLSGRDRLKPDAKEPIAESTGVVIGIIYIFAVLLMTPFTLSNDTTGKVTIGRLTAHLSGILSIQSMIMLGFADDLFDLRWRHKFFLPAIAAVPMLAVYYVEHGNTHVAVPKFLQSVLNSGTSLDLGWIYYIYMAAVSIFATNCINIYAGVNGLEVGQTVVVALGVLANDAIYIVRNLWYAPIESSTMRAHYLSVYFVLPLLAASLALLRYNWCPAKVFVGDTFCYFAGMVLAVAGIQGHFAKTMLSLILPQIINFLYSVPQLLRIVPCPRHRMPVLEPKSRKLLPSRVDITELSTPKLLVLKLLAKVGLLKIWKSEGKIEASNMTLINLTLVHLGPLREEDLTKSLMVLQLVSCVLALVARHMLARVLFGQDNL